MRVSSVTRNHLAGSASTSQTSKCESLKNLLSLHRKNCLCICRRTITSTILLKSQVSTRSTSSQSTRLTATPTSRCRLFWLTPIHSTLTSQKRYWRMAKRSSSFTCRSPWLKTGQQTSTSPTSSFGSLLSTIFNCNWIMLPPMSRLSWLVPPSATSIHKSESLKLTSDNLISSARISSISGGCVRLQIWWSILCKMLCSSSGQTASMVNFPCGRRHTLKTRFQTTRLISLSWTKQRTSILTGAWLKTQSLKMD